MKAKLLQPVRRKDARGVMPDPDDLCVCGETYSDHGDDGSCVVCGGCEKFSPAAENDGSDRPDTLPGNLTPGVLDGYARREFTHGACGALAIALHDATGWPIVAVTDHHNVDRRGRALGGSALHWAVKRPDGKLVDVDGAHTSQELVRRYSPEADDGRAAAGLSSREHCWEWYVESQGEPIPVSLAATFVKPVLDQL